MLQSIPGTSFNHFMSQMRPSHPGGDFTFCICSQSPLTLCDPMDCQLPGSSGHGISQARIQKWVAIFFCRGSSQPWDRAHISCISSVGKKILYHLATWEAPFNFADRGRGGEGKGGVEATQTSLEFSLCISTLGRMRVTCSFAMVGADKGTLEAVFCFIVAVGFRETMDKEVPPDEVGNASLLLFTVVA